MQHRIVATVTGIVQVGEDRFNQHNYSRVFSVECSIASVISWASAELGRQASINDVEFSFYTGESK
jgi:hypothetical protein